MNTITNNPDHALAIAHRLIDDHIQAAQRRAQIHELRAVRRAAARRRQRPTPPSRRSPRPVFVPRAARTFVSELGLRLPARRPLNHPDSGAGLDSLRDSPRTPRGHRAQQETHVQVEPAPVVDTESTGDGRRYQRCRRCGRYSDRRGGPGIRAAHRPRLSHIRR